MTTIRRPGSGRPIDSHVLRPMMIVCPIVSRLNRCRSADKMPRQIVRRGQ